MRDIEVVIRGGQPLTGRVSVSGAKNAALPDLAAVVLGSGSFRFENVPLVEDIRAMVRALHGIGAEGEFAGNTIELYLGEPSSGLVHREIAETSRASILLLGPLLARTGYAKVSLPGGCRIGDRKFNYHLQGLEKMGADIRVDDGHILARARRLKGVEYTFPQKTVTGSENLLMASTLADGESILTNCAQEPEIADLVIMLKKMGADIEPGSEPGAWRVRGRTSLEGASHRIIPDRIEAGTYLIAGCFRGNDVIVEGVVPDHVSNLSQTLRTMGVDMERVGGGLRVIPSGRIFGTEIETRPYPGFPTDLQAQLTTLLTQAEGTSRVTENIFNNRFQHVVELNRLGARIVVRGNLAVIEGQTPLRGRSIGATDLRASAALVLGGLIASGETRIKNAFQLFRGYEKMPEKLQSLGADIRVDP